jgi:uridine phosphorylase
MSSHDKPEVFIKAVFGCNPDEIAETVVMSPFDETLDALRVHSDNVKEFKGFFRLINGEINGKMYSYINSRIGSPMAADCTNYLSYTRCKTIVYVGLMGGLQPQVKVGDIIIPTGAYRGEGASKIFIEESFPASADYQLTMELLKSFEEVFKDTGTGIHTGVIYSTDSISMESEKFLKKCQERKMIAIDMETSAIYVVATLRGIACTSVHIASDNPLEGLYYFEPMPEKETQRLANSKMLIIKALVKFLENH